ncbi:CsbD family protein [Neobacillus notoginsengisoli]|uniref:CsbD family protein n=1 Tax=Neobacillus notoginsengisoli TaxID=1578198 RepID=A0A417YRY8_9BACI|nr:CsbD family protein [Neobacillus notoginsengisoli]RHW38063.1 CsbD family protein [Neobacillus notoginsengisoli]
MNKDETKGAWDQLKGEVKRTAGKVSDNESLEAEGNVDKGKGILKEKYGGAKERLASEFNNAIDKTR